MITGTYRLQDKPKPYMLDAHQLNIFLTAAETLNFTEAAHRLHMSQPSVSQHIRTLEKHFGAKLFIRQGRSIALSDAGRTLIPLAEKFVKQSTVIDETMSSLHGRIQGRILVGCNAEVGKYILPQYFAQFHGEHPDITITCKTKSLVSPYRSLSNGTIHFLVTDDIRPLQKNNYETRPIIQEKISLISSVDHPWAGKKALKAEALTQGNFILHDEEYLISEIIQDALLEKNVDFDQLSSFLHLGDTEAIVLAVEKGLGLGFASHRIAHKLGDVRIVPIHDLNITRDVYIVRNLNQPITAARQAFWDFIANSDRLQMDI